MAIGTYTPFFKGKSYRHPEWTPYTAGTLSGQVFSCFVPNGLQTSPSTLKDTYPTLYRGKPKSPFMIWVRIDGYISSPGILANSSAIDLSPAIAANDGSGTGIAGAGVACQWLANGGILFCLQVTSAAISNGGGGTIPNGNGVFHAPGGTSGLYESRNTPNAKKDVVAAVQFIQWACRNPSLLVNFSAAEQAMFAQCDPDRWGIMGSSSAFDTAFWTGAGPNRAFELGSDPIFTQNTVPNVMLGLNYLLTDYSYFDFNQVTSGQFPNSETGAGASTIASPQSQCPPRYKREASATHVLSDVGAWCMPLTMCWVDKTSVSQIISKPFAGTETGGHNAGVIVALKHMMPQGLIYMATGSTGKFLNSVDMTHLFDRVDLSGPDQTLVPNGLDADGYNGLVNPDQPIGPDGKQYRSAIRHLMDGVNTRRWDAELPYEGIARRGQVNVVGSYRVPPRANRAGILLECFSGRDQEPLMYGSGGYAEKILDPGRSVVLQTKGPLWIGASGYSLATARFEAREIGNL